LTLSNTSLFLTWYRTQNVANSKSCYTLFLTVTSNVLYHIWKLLQSRKHYIVIKLRLICNVFRHHAFLVEKYTNMQSSL
jgi:hypothetical protein